MVSYLHGDSRHFPNPTVSTLFENAIAFPLGAKAHLELKGRRKTMSFFERLKAEASAEWRAYTEHPFTNGMADGSLPEAAFRHYLVQDYLFLIEFARAYALSVYKSPTLADMREGAAGLSAILDVEMDLHVKLCAGWGLSPGDLEQAPPAAEMLAYTRYVLDAGMRGDLLALKVALAPCVIGYAEIATRLAARPDARCRNEPLPGLDRRVCRCAIPGGRGEGPGAPGSSRRSLRHARSRSRAGRNFQGSDPARDRLLGNGMAGGQAVTVGKGHWLAIASGVPAMSSVATAVCAR